MGRKQTRSVTDVQFYSESNKKKQCCTKKRACLIVLIIALPVTIVLLVALALLIFFLFPRKPSIYESVRAAGLSLRPSALAVDAEMYISITIDNKNFYSIGIENLVLEAYYWCREAKCFNGTEPPKTRNGVSMGKIEYTPKLTFAARKNTTGNELRLTLYGDGLNLRDYTRIGNDCSSDPENIAIGLIGNLTVYMLNVKVPVLIPVKTTTRIGC
jgi:hypothetical protein